MTPRLTWHSLRFWLAAIGASGGSGVLFAYLTGAGHPLAGAFYGICIGGAVMAFERGVLFGRFRDMIRGWATPLYVLAAELALVAMIAVGQAAGGVVTWLLGVREGTLADGIGLTPVVLVYSLVVSAIIVTVVRMRDLIGGEIFLDLVLGRYHKPVREERIFLFLDVVGSTRFAEVEGDLRTQEYLAAVFAAIAKPIRDHRGSIDDYVGDMALVTWPLPRGAEKGRCVACVFAILDRIEAEAAAWQARFGVVPRFRAALHGGTVVTAEVGVDRHKIAYFGDVVNTTGRLQSLSRTLGNDVLISEDLLARLPVLPRGVRAARLGDYAVAGKDQPLGVAALAAA